jgi:tetratricopeptide (TPR) repeat protein
VTLGLVLGASAAPAQEASPLQQAIARLAEAKYAEATKILEGLVMEAPSEEAYYYLGLAHQRQGHGSEAALVFSSGAARFPLSARLANAAGVAYEQQFEVGKAIQHYRRAYALDPQVIYNGGGRYEPEFDAIYIPVVHDHRGANACSGRLYVNPEGLHFVVYIVASEWGPGNDDSFRTPLTNIEFVEVDRKKGQQAYDYSLITLLTNLSGPRRRVDTGEQTRVDLKFVFKQPLQGYRGKPWNKEDIKFFFIEPEVGERLLKFLEAQDVKSTLRK